MRNYQRLVIVLGCLGILLVGSYWYVFIAGAPQLDAPSVASNTGLSFEVQSFFSPAMGTERKYGLILPYGYYQNVQERYPVIFLLHGGHGDEYDYDKKAALTTVLHQLYETKRLPPSIVVTPDGNDRRGSSPFWDPQYYDGQNGKIDTLIGEELVQVIKSRYRTVDDPRLWAIGGLSSGGWGALNIGLHHRNQFKILFSHSGYFTDKSGINNSPLLYIKQIPESERQQLHIYLDAGLSDGIFLVSTKKFHQELEKLGVDHEYHAFPGGHGLFGADIGWNYWHKHLFDSLSYVGRYFQKVLRASSPNHSVN